ncbi:MAG: extracellular solute-binding protein [Candidatus Nomurabacteria bacterium]|nr:extracellular solute-binding protein [Candidatus Nomurabacteria bacterium]
MKGNFQLILVIIFIVAAVVGIMVFSGAIPLGNKKDVSPLKGNVTLWGTQTKTAMASADFKSTYAGAAEVFLGNKGTIAFPLTIDPLVMYYNRSILDTNGIVYPPTYWDEFNEMSGKITKKDDAGQIIKSAVGFGQYSNVNNAKDIVTALFMQTGNPIVQNEGGALRSSLSGLETSKSLGDALAFYTSFADPLKPSYSWNKGFPNSQDAFSSGSVAFYFGFASELPTLIKKNPNQNLGIAPLPQIKNSSTKATRGRVAGIAVSSFSKNFTTAYATATHHQKTPMTFSD